jgi:tetratricopeptide (TPR) repeat protein
MNGKARHFLVLLAVTLGFSASARLARSEEEWLKAFNEGTRHYQMRDFPQALLAWERSLKLHPTQAGTYANIAKVQLILGRYREAITAFDKALELRPPAKWAAIIWHDKGHCYRELKLYHKAVEALGKALEIDPDTARFWARLGDNLSRVGHTEEAVKAYEKALELKPGDANATEALEDENLRLEKEPRPFPSTMDEVRLSRMRSHTLDLKGAAQALADCDQTAPLVKTELAEIEARREYLDALGAAIPPGTLVVVEEGEKRAKLVRASSKGVEVEGGSAPVPWPLLPRGTAALLAIAADKAVTTAPLGAVLVLTDLGLWARVDQRTKAWADADPAGAVKAFEVAARYRGLAETPQGGFLWKGNEYVTVAEDDARAHDLVTVDGKAIPREEARRQIEKQRTTRRVAKKNQVAEARARAEKLLKDYGVTEIKTLVAAGDPIKRMDVVVVADGFTSAELGAFEKAADAVARTVLTVEPFKNYSRYVSVHRVSVVAEESGLAGTRLGAKLEKGRILVCDRDLAATYGRLAPDADLVIACVNVKDVRATGSPGVITIDASGEFSDTFLHELGHAVGLLDDEYVDASVTDRFVEYDKTKESEHVNTTRDSNPKSSKWHYWLLPPAIPEKIGCFEGCFYRDKGYFRPASNCRMRTMNFKSYCPVCLEQMEKSFYSRLEPIDDVSVRVPEVFLWKDDATKIAASTIAITAGAEKLGGFVAKWYVDDRPAPAAAVKSAGVKTELNLKTLNLPAGAHEAVLRVDLKDVRVRRDDGLLSSVRAWRLYVKDTPRPRITAPERVTAVRGEPVSFDVSVEGLSADQRLDAEGPMGSAFIDSDQGGRFVWCPGRTARGLFHLVLKVGLGDQAVKHVTEILIQDPAHNVPPVFRDQGLVLAARGKDLALKLEAFDADGDGLVFTAKKLPEGAILDPMRGILYWRPSYSSPLDAESDVVVKVSDGVGEDEMTFKLRVDNRPLEGATWGFDVLQATRSTSVEVRKAAFASLLECDLPRGAKLLELSRLLRDADAEVAKKACQTLSEALEVSEKSARSLVALDLQDRVFELADRPDALAFLKQFGRYLFSAEAEPAAARIQKDLAAVEAYNKGRGAP